uniref:Transposase n=1 Tax=Angiostrongylus cantonensis TaxID=6313 RepID=A0A0K0CYS5_ANGCA
MKAESSKVTKRRMSAETLELIWHRGIARAAGNRELTSELAKQCRRATKEDIKERRAAVVAYAAEAWKTIGRAHRSFAKYKTEVIALPDLDGAEKSSRKATERIIHDFFPHLFISSSLFPDPI